jgi:pimeloyl-ACP methyl ester carboxylesterase
MTERTKDTFHRFKPVSDVTESGNTPFRRVAYIECGDPRGLPVLYCHGFPSSGREARLLNVAAIAAGARIIAPDRPGYGESSFQPNRAIADWAQDVAFLADSLGIGRFALLGVSGGGPYALACAWRIPQRICGCALVCPLGPVYLESMLAKMNLWARINLGMARRVPYLSQILLGSVTTGLANLWPRYLHTLRKLHANGADLAELASSRKRRVLDGAIADAVRGGARGARQDLVLYTRDWSIPLERIELRMDVWHGEEDGIVPLSHSRWYASHLRNAQIHYLPKEGHYSLPMRHAEEILHTLLAQGA